MISPETGENVQITMDVMEVVRVFLSVSKLTKQGTQVTFEHHGGSIRKLVRDRKTERPKLNRFGTMATWSQLSMLSPLEGANESKFLDDMMDVREERAEAWPKTGLEEPTVASKRGICRPTRERSHPHCQCGLPDADTLGGTRVPDEQQEFPRRGGATPPIDRRRR